MTPTLTPSERVGLFAGSFNPFTLGHADIVERGLKIFDKLIIAIGRNANKPCDSADKSLASITELYSANPRVEVMTYTGLTADLAAEQGATIIRGVRSVKDFEYERDMAEINQRLRGVDTIFLVAKPEFAAISSSVVRELQSYGVNTQQFLP